MEAVKSVATRYDDNMRAAVYLWWRTAGGRSISKSAKRFHVDYNTIKLWIERDSWVDRANDEDRDDYASSRIGVAAIVVNELVPSIEEAVRIRDYGTDDKVRLAAAQWLAGLAGVSPVSKIETAVTDHRPQVIDVTPDFGAMSVQELRAYEDNLKRSRKTDVANR